MNFHNLHFCHSCNQLIIVINRDLLFYFQNLSYSMEYDQGRTVVIKYLMRKLPPAVHNRVTTTYVVVFFNS